MPISEWFKSKSGRQYTAVSPDERGDLPEGVWTKCAKCRHIVYQGEIDRSGGVCPHCGHHFEFSAHDRVSMLADAGTFQEFDAALTSSNPLGFAAAKTYEESLAAARERTGLPEAVVTGRAEIGGHGAVLGAMDFRFIGASMGSVVGEKVTRAFEVAQAERRSVVMVTASGGARMQEGMLSLMQMAKTAAAVSRFASARRPYVAILTDPTMGGVTASFATLADVILAEPGALVGFAGPRVIEQTIRQHVPKGFQSAEFLMDHGMVDAIVPRREMRETVIQVLDLLADAPPAGEGVSP